MHNNKKVIISDLDGTLAESKSLIPLEMANVICSLLAKHFFAVVSGGALSQFKKQFLSQLHCEDEQLQNLYLFPTNGSACYVYKNGDWQELYNEMLSLEDRSSIISALSEAIKETGLDLSNPYGEIIEDRGSQVTFSGRGQEAPPDVKKAWDPDGIKRKSIVDIIKNQIPQFEIRVNSGSSIDITKKGIDKAYAIGRIKEILNVADDDVIFVGDALYKGGNDFPVKKTDVDYIQESGPDQTIEFLKQYI